MTLGTNGIPLWHRFGSYTVIFPMRCKDAFDDALKNLDLPYRPSAQVSSRGSAPA